MSKNRVKETTVSTSAATITLAGTSTGFRSFSAGPGVGATAVEVMVGPDIAGAWLIGLYTLTDSTTLTRTAIVDSSAGGSDVTFASGSKDVFPVVSDTKVGSFVSNAAPTVTSIENQTTATIPVISGAGVTNRITVEKFIAEIGQTPDQLAPAGTLGEADVMTVYRGGVELQTTLTALAAAIAAINGGTPPATDTTAPVLSSATGAATGATTASGTVVTNEANGTLYYLVNTSTTATATAIKAANSQAISSTGTKTVTATGLTASTAYYIHYLHRDAAGNDSAVVRSASFTTSAASDTTAPVLSAPLGTQTGETTASGGATTNEANGTLYRYVSANATEAAATIKAAALTTAVSSAGAIAVTFTGLTAGTQYYAHYVHRDAAGNDSNVVSSAAFTTAAAAALVDYTITGNGSNAIKSTLDASDANKSNTTAYANIRGFGYTKYATTQYWNITPPSGGSQPATAHAGWSEFSNVPPDKITAAQHQANSASINGATPMTHPAAWSSTNYLWLPTTPGTYVRYFWILPEGGIPKVVGSITATVT